MTTALLPIVTEPVAVRVVHALRRPSRMVRDGSDPGSGGIAGGPPPRCACASIA